MTFIAKNALPFFFLASYHFILIAKLHLTLVTLWTIAHQVWSVEFPRQEYGVGSHFFFQGISPTQRSNLHLLHSQTSYLPLSHQATRETKFLYY